MCDVMKRIKAFCLLLLGVVWLLSPFSVMAETWPIKEFKVVRGNPYPTTWAKVKQAQIIAIEGTQAQASYAVALEEQYEQEQEDLKKAPTISDEVLREIERWLGVVAHEYERMGFKSPFYEDKDSNKYRVYLYHFSTAGPAAMLTRCASGGYETYMKVDSKRNIANGKLTVKAYQDLAHELFHAVQSSYDLFFKYGCIGGWIVEGTAELVGIEMARKLYPKKQPFNICQMGIRSYSERLYQTSSRDSLCNWRRSYQTLSFWQFLGEYQTGFDKNEQEKFVTPDFRYLHDFFNTDHVMGSRSKEYAWLDKVLRQKKSDKKHQFGISLHTAYSRFAGTFASYWKNARRKQYPSSTLLDTKRKWIEGVYGKCKEVLVKKGASIPPMAFPIGPIAARCIKVNFHVRERVKLTFYVSGDNQSLALESLAISTMGGGKIIRRHPGEPHPNKLGHFIVSPAPNKMVPGVYFIVSNVARDAAQTVSLSPSIRIVPEISSSTMAEAKKKPDSTSNPKPQEELENTLESRSWTGDAYQKQKTPCTVRPFEARPCGPVTKLDLGLESDAGKTLRESVQPGMSFNRMMDVLGAVDQKGGEQVVLDMIDQSMEIQQQDGAGVSIVIPQIQPGFTGTISNAHIAVSKALNSDGSDNGGYDAIGPWVGSCQDGYWPATGKATIDEFSQYEIRGSFSAKLVDSKTRKSCQSAPIARSIKGTFTITEIDWGQNQPVPNVSDDAIIDRTVEDINEFLPGLITDDLKEAAKERAKLKRQEQKQSKQEKAAKRKKDSVFQQCRCRCEMENNFCAANPGATCCVSCEPLFKLCKGNPKSHAIPLTAEEHAKEDAEVQAMRQRYEAYVDSLALPNEAIKQQMMKAFNDLNTVDEKKLFMMAIPE